MKIRQQYVEDLILSIGGNEGLSIYKLLKNKQNVNEFDMAGKLKLTINQTRNIIYKFEKYNLVSFTRKKDRKKGWYIYFFTFNEKEAENLVVKTKEERIKKLENLLKLEASHEFYSCPNQCTRTTLENAMDSNFMCHECNELMQPEKKDRNIARVKSDIEKLKKEFEEIKQEEKKIAKKHSQH